MSPLHTPLRIGDRQLGHRVVMAPLTRMPPEPASPRETDTPGDVSHEIR